MNSEYVFWKNFFDDCNIEFLKRNANFLLSKVNERSICGSFAQQIKEKLNLTEYKKYYVDVEYNRNDGKIKTILNDKLEIVKVNCDLIIHSRGEKVELDNILALEMKKSYRQVKEKEMDRARVKTLTKTSFDNVWSYDGTTYPEHVCRYIIGIYYEINIARRNILLEYYSRGDFMEKRRLMF
jgi:hypothetical protein